MSGKHFQCNKQGFRLKEKLQSRWEGNPGEIFSSNNDLISCCLPQSDSFSQIFPALSILQLMTRES